MRRLLIELPDLQTLTQSLNAMFANDNATKGQTTILAREPNLRTSTYPSEIVTCRLADGSELRLLCKYTDGRSHISHGHRGGVRYEASVYRHVIQSLPVSTPKFYGVDKDAATGEMWFVIEYIDRSVRVKDSLDPVAMHEAARWLGQFHRENETNLSTTSLPFLNRHDGEYYLGWAARTSLLADDLHQRYPWLATLCERFEDVFAALLEPPAIIIHGEYYPGNILYHDGMIDPVDWESAAVAAGEIDLASLIENWPLEIVTMCKGEYQSTRWPKGAPVDFESKLDAAQMYWHFRWLGDRKAWTHDQEIGRFEQLHVLGKRLGLI